MGRSSWSLFVGVSVAGVMLSFLGSQMASGEEIGRESQESRWTEFFENDLFAQLWGMVGMNMHSRAGTFPSDYDAGKASDKHAHVLLGVRMRFGDEGPTTLFGNDGRYVGFFEVYGHSNFFFHLGQGATAFRGSFGANVMGKLGTERVFGKVSGTFAAEHFFFADYSDSPMLDYWIVNGRVLLGAGVWVAPRVSIEVGFVAAYLFKWTKFAIGGELVFTIGHGLLRMLYLTQFDEDRALGPHPYLLAAFEWRIASGPRNRGRSDS